jgi:phage baseplate assembly protein W
LEYTIDTSEEINIDWSATGKERIVQNVRNLISTAMYEVSYSRKKGIDSSLFDKPSNIASSLYISEIYRVVDEYESRATVKSVTYLGVNYEGHMEFKVVIDI